MGDDNASNVLVSTRMSRLPTAAESLADPESARHMLMTEALRTLAEGMTCLSHALRASIGECGIDSQRLASLYRRATTLEQAVDRHNGRAE
jgi:hypothetical protein